MGENEGREEGGLDGRREREEGGRRKEGKEITKKSKHSISCARNSIKGSHWPKLG